MDSDSQTIMYSAVCGFVDILGQKTELSKFDDTPLTSELAEDEEFQQLVGRTFGRVQFFHKGLSDFILNISRQLGKSVPGKAGEYIRTISANDIGIHPFSDGIFLSLPLTHDKEICPINGIACMLSACAFSMLHNLAIETPVRGGIEIGTIAEIGHNVFYGPGVAAAHDLESHIAQYPRIVLGPKLAEYIMATCNMTPDDAKTIPHVTNPEAYAAISSVTAKICRDMVLRDFDGHYIVHYLSPQTLNSMGDEETGTLAKHAHEYVISQANHWQKQRNTKMSMRYSHLVQYFGAYYDDNRCNAGSLSGKSGE